MEHKSFKERGMYRLVIYRTREEMIEMGFEVPPEPFKGFTYGTHPLCKEPGCRYCPEMTGPMPVGIGCED